MFIDEALIQVKAGDGGNGCFSHFRARYIPRGKPNGGSGGRGGNIYMKGTNQIHTLQDVLYHHSYKAGRGTHGKGSNKNGAHGKDITIPIPLGTIIKDNTTGAILFDCVHDGERITVAKGGRGGKGNAALVSRSNPNPERAEFGKTGQQKELRLVLKVLADIGLVGRPNAGKSTFLSSISKAHPKIADYPFTTTEPHLGIVQTADDFTSFVVADIPGLIEGSHQGKGLGIRFLRHIERTRVLAIMIEATTDDPLASAEILISELKQYSPTLAEKPKCFILTKTDLISSTQQPDLPNWLYISSVTRAGIKDALFTFQKLIKQTSND